MVFRKNRRSFRVFLLLLCLVLLLTACSNAPVSGNHPPFLLTFLTIGKGDAFLLETPEAKTYLIDTGKAQDYVQIARALRVKGIGHLNGIFLTHGHKDHAGNLKTLLEAFPTDTVFYWAEDRYSYQDILPGEIVPAFDTDLVSPDSGTILNLGGVTAEVFLPPEPDLENENNNSMILMLTHGENKFLMMGDAELGEEQLLMESSMDLKANVLKLGHHGEDDASSPEFLDRVRPELGLIAGNMEENPESMDREIGDRLSSRNIHVLYSQSPGLGYKIVSDGKDLELREFQDRDLPETPEIRFAQVDRKGQRVTVRNEGRKTADLGGCLIRSVRRDEMYLFPEGTTLSPGESLTVACRDSGVPGDLTWDADSVWQEKRDKARLYDRNLNLLDQNLP